ncbi:MAG: hypothetical protein RLN62_04620 [Rickettsiales bacterium]
MIEKNKNSLPSKQINHSIVSDSYNWVKENIKADFQVTNNTKRYISSYGYDYLKLVNGDSTYTPIPEILLELCKEISYAFQEHSLPNCERYQNIIVSVYNSGFLLEPHVDVNKESKSLSKPGFYFGNIVLGVVLKKDETGHLYVSHDSDPFTPIMDLEEKEGTAFLLQEEFRFRPYLHGVTKTTNERVSVTFRTVELSGNEWHQGEEL